MTRAAILLVTLCAGCDGQAGGRKMAELTFENGLTTETITAPVKTIRSVAAERLPAATVDTRDEYFRPFGNNAANSRVSRALPKGEWKLRWQADLDPDFTPFHIMEAGDRILLQSGVWQLFSREGALISRERSAGAPMVADTANGLFYRIAPDSYFVAARLDNGQHAFRFLPAYGDKFSRVHIARSGTRVLIAGVERELDPHGGKRAEESLIEVNDVGPSPKPDDLGFLSDIAPAGVLRIPDPKLVAASSEDRIVAARRGFVYVIRWDLQVEAAIEGNFEPQAISLDEAGRIYMIARVGGQYSLTLMNQAGDRLYAWELPSGSLSTSPPIVGYDHTAYVLAGNQVFAVAQDGALRWSRTSRGKIAGAVVTADGLLLATESTGIAAYDSRAERTVLVRGDSFVTPPLLSRSGDLMVASKTRLYCYSTQ